MSARSKVNGCPGPSGTYRRMSCSAHTTSYFNDSASGRAIERGTGVTSPIQWLDRRGVSIGTGRISRFRSWAIAAYSSIISRYVTTSGPPMSKVRFTSAGISTLPTRYRSTSRTAIGWILVDTQLGVTMTGRRSVR